MRRLSGEPEPLSDEEAETHRSLEAERQRLEQEHKGSDELPEHVDRRLGEIEAAMEAIEDRPVRFAADDVARAGVFVSIDGSGRLRVERGYVRPEDEPPVEADELVEADTADLDDGTDVHSSVDVVERDDEEGDPAKPLPDRLVTKLTAHRTLALRDALAGDPEIAFLAALHALALRVFYRFAPDTCLEIDPRSATFGAQAPGLGDTTSAQAIEARHDAWTRMLPKATEELWRLLAGFDRARREALFAHCVALTVNAVHEPYNRRPRALAHADMLATELGLDMAAAGWRATAANYLGRVTKARILEAVREAKGEAAAERIAGLKKPDMVAAAEELLDGTGWLPQPLRTPCRHQSATTDPGEAQSAADGGEPAMADAAPLPQDEPVAGAVPPAAAE